MVLMVGVALSVAIGGGLAVVMVFCVGAVLLLASVGAAVMVVVSFTVQYNAFKASLNHMHQLLRYSSSEICLVFCFYN